MLELLQGIEAVKVRPPIAVILGGGIACGKTTMAKQIGRSIVVSSQLSFPRIVDIDQLSSVREEGYRLAIQQLANCAVNRLDIVLATPIGKEIPFLLAQSDFDVHVVYVDVPELIARERLARRVSLTVSDAFVHATHVLSARYFLELLACSEFKSVVLYNTMTKAHPVYNRDLRPSVIDIGYWKRFRAKALEVLDPQSQVLRWEHKGVEDFKVALSDMSERA